MDDLISRQAAIDKMQMFIDSLDKEATAYKSLMVAFNRCIIELKRIPSAQQERKNGRWLVDEDGNMECPFCGNTCGFGNYCNECGADLRGDVDD